MEKHKQQDHIAKHSKSTANDVFVDSPSLKTVQPPPLQLKVSPTPQKGVLQEKNELSSVTKQFSSAGDFPNENSVQLKQESQQERTPFQLKKSENNTGLPDSLKSGVESLSGFSLDDVNVHYNSPKPAQLNAHAYAQGTDIHVSSGQEKHLPHEAWHVVQQKQGRVKPTTPLKESININDDTGLEHEADLMGEKASNHTGQDYFQLKDKSNSETANNEHQPVQRFIGEKAIRLVKRAFSYIKSIYRSVVSGSQPASQGVMEAQEPLTAIKAQKEEPAVKEDIESATSTVAEIASKKDAETQDTSTEAPKSKGLQQYKDDELVVKEFVTKDHMLAISNYCKRNNIILSTRDTGSYSLKRVEEGAKPKPHSILEKSIKKSSLSGAHKAEADWLDKNDGSEAPKIEGISLNDLTGFVGHWHPETKALLGVRVDKKDVLKTEQTGDDDHSKGLNMIQGFLAGKDGDSPYIPLKRFEAYKDALGPQWKHFLYTGDYDLHEVYKNKKTLMEASIEKARALSGINAQIASEQSKDEANSLPARKGKIGVHKHSATIGEGSSKREVSADTLHAEEGSQYAMIQHGDQMGYITNQIHEGRLKDETKGNKAQLVKPVAEESPGPLAWCVRGPWYVTKNKEEHSAFRSLIGVTASSGWSDKAQKKMHDGESRTLELISKNPSKLGAKPEPLDKVKARKEWLAKREETGGFWV